MQYTTLGKTGLTVSVAGLGCGGPSRLGLRKNAQSESSAIAIIRQALDLGINFFDTAEAYGTETVVGKAISASERGRLVLSTKKTLPAPEHPDPDAEIARGLDQSLKRLGTDYIDVYHLHGVEPNDYAYVRERLMPAMVRLKEQGKIRFIGVTEAFVPDPSHTMLRQSLSHGLWDVVMVGFNLLNPSARRAVLPLTRDQGIGVLNMFAVRRALSQPERLKAIVAELMQNGVIAPGSANPEDPLDFALQGSAASSLPEAAYRYCRHEPGIDVVLTGTGNAAHLEANVESILKPPLPESVQRRLDDLFGNLDYLTGN